MCFGERGVRLSIPVNGRERELLKCVEVCEPRIHTTYTIVWTIDTEGWLIKRSTTSDRKVNKEKHENLDNITFGNSSNRLKGMLKIATLKGRVESNFTFHLFIVREPSRKNHYTRQALDITVGSNLQTRGRLFGVTLCITEEVADYCPTLWNTRIYTKPLNTIGAFSTAGY